MPNPTSRAASQPALTRLPRGTLSQAVIIEAALAVSERKGLGALSFQALGAELGAHPTAIYRHFRDKDELVLAVVDGLYAEMLAELAPSSEDWAADLRTLATTMHDVFVRHPAVAQIAAARTSRREHEFELVEQTISCFRRSGMTDADAARYYRIFSDLVLGYSAIDAALAALDPKLREADLRAWQVEYRTLPPAEFPNLTAVTSHIPAIDDPSNFRTAVDLMIEAIRARTAAAEVAD
jgi:AcrR family transcriptional regulator